jgi:metal-responsive CopG/Arc/MetJ family transcriptional regulator
VGEVELTVESTVEHNPHVETIQVVLDGELLKAADRAARRLKINRSAFIRQAMRAHLRAVRVRDREEADRRGYEQSKESAAELAAWDRVAAWPEE